MNWLSLETSHITRWLKLKVTSLCEWHFVVMSTETFQYNFWCHNWVVVDINVLFIRKPPRLFACLVTSIYVRHHNVIVSVVSRHSVACVYQCVSLGQRLDRTISVRAVLMETLLLYLFSPMFVSDCLVVANWPVTEWCWSHTVNSNSKIPSSHHKWSLEVHFKKFLISLI